MKDSSALAKAAHLAPHVADDEARRKRKRQEEEEEEEEEQEDLHTNLRDAIEHVITDQGAEYTPLELADQLSRHILSHGTVAAETERELRRARTLRDPLTAFAEMFQRPLHPDQIVQVCLHPAHVICDRCAGCVLQTFSLYAGPIIYELNRSRLKLTPVELKTHHVSSRGRAIVVFVEHGLYAVALSHHELTLSSTLQNLIGEGSKVRMPWLRAF